MSRKSSRTSQYPHALKYSLLAIGLWCVSVLVGVNLLVPQQLYAHSRQGVSGRTVGDPAMQAVAIAKPAVVRVWTDVLGHLTILFPPTTSVSFPQQTNGNYQLSLTGSGVFISAQGDVLTADHLVHPPDQVLNPALYKAAAQDVANYMNQNAKPGSPQVTAKDVLGQLTNGTLQSSPVYASPTIHVYLSTDYAGPYAASDLQSLPSTSVLTVNAIKAFSSSDQQDQAIVHVPVTVDTPGVALGNSDNVQLQDQLMLIGFPALSGDAVPKPQAFLTSSSTSVVVSSTNPSKSGAPLIQVSGNLNDDDNGSPALNSQGEIVGTQSFDDTTGAHFLQASKSALQLAQSINLDMTPGPFEKLWRQAYDDYAATTPGHWHKAEQEFSQLANSYPLFQAVQPLLSETRTQAETEPSPVVSPVPTQAQHGTSSPHPSSSTGLAQWQVWALTIGPVVLVLVLVIWLFALSMGKRRKKTLLKEEPSLANNPSSGSVSGSSPSLSATSPPPPLGGAGQITAQLTALSCGHMNRVGAKFCNICGERAAGT